MLICKSRVISIFLILSDYSILAQKVETKDKLPIVIVRLDNAYFREIGGFPPPDRNAYLPTIEKIKKYKPQAMFFDFSFVRPPLSSEKSFARKLNEGLKLVLPFQISAADYTENFSENAESMGSRIPFVSNKTKTTDKSPGILFPYPEIVKESESVCVSNFYPENDNIIRNLYPVAYYREHVFPAISICILNQYLKSRGFQIILPNGGRELYLMKWVEKKWISKKKIFEIINEKGEEFTIPISFERYPFYTGYDIMNESVVLPEKTIVIVGPAADTVGFWGKTPLGLMPGVHIVANEVNTLWQMIKNDIPAEKP
jgi:CHASE2 domain-containing sensor protein